MPDEIQSLAQEMAGNGQERLSGEKLDSSIGRVPRIMAYIAGPIVIQMCGQNLRIAVQYLIQNNKVERGVDQMKSTSTSYSQPNAATSSLYFVLWLLDSLHKSIAALRASIVLLLATIALAGCMTSGDDAADAPSLELFAGHPGGEGNADGTGAAARFSAPLGIATDSVGNVYVADCRNNTIRKITPAAVVTTLAGSARVEGHADGAGAAATFSCPHGVATDTAGNVYVADTGNNTIRKIATNGVVTTLAGTAAIAGFADGTGADARFSSPSGVTADSAGNIYVADTGNNVIRKITSTGAVATLAGTAGVEGRTDGTGSAASFNQPTAVATDNAGNVYVADVGNGAIRKITQTGNVTTLAGVPSGYTVATDSADNLYMADNGNNTIHKITPAGVVTTLAGTVGVAGQADGMGAAASFSHPYGIATDNLGNVYVSDSDFSIIRKINLSGGVTTLAGRGWTLGHADGVGTSASFAGPTGIATDSAGNLYVADMVNNTIRKITPKAEVTTLAGTVGVTGSADGVGAAATFSSPLGVATDSTGNVYVADTLNQLIRKIIPTGNVTTLAGTALILGHADGTGTAARFANPWSVTTDHNGNVYVADNGNQTIRKITQEGEVTTLAGTAGVWGHADDTGAAASFNSPIGVAADSAGNIYVADCGNSTIRKITSTGEVTTVAGTAGVQGYADGVGAAASFSCPSALVTDPAGNIYVADSGSHTIRKITPAGVVTTVVGQAGVIGFTPGNLPGVLDNPRGIALSGRTLYITTSDSVVRVTNVP